MPLNSQPRALDTVVAANLAFDKSGGLLPAIVQDASTHRVLMLGYMNREALEHTCQSGLVTFFSRSKGRLWTKGETSGNVMRVAEVLVDCDNDTLLVKAQPTGPVCHTGTDTCFNESNQAVSEPNHDDFLHTDSLHTDFLHTLEAIIRDRKENPSEASYTSKLLACGINKVAQKVGEEAVELVIEAKDANNDLFIGEAADLLFHTLILLAAKDVPLNHVLAELRRRHKPQPHE